MRKLSLIAAFTAAGALSAYAAEPTATPTAKGSAVSTTEATTPETRNIAELAMADSRFETLVTAIKAAGLAETLAGPGPYTVFAPTNDAFAKLPAGKVEELLKPENKAQLANLLSYHVVSGSIRAEDIPEGVTEVPTLTGGMLKVEKTAAGVTVNGAAVVATDIKASNGYIHAIDAVAMPATATN